MLNGFRNYVLIAAFFAILGMSEACSASSLSRFKTHSHSHSHFHFHSRRIDLTHSRAAHQTRVVVLRADSLLSPTLDDEVEAPDESEDDQGDELRDALPQGEPVSPVLAFECVGDAIWPATALRPLSREGGIAGSARPRFLSLCRLLI